MIIYILTHGLRLQEARDGEGGGEVVGPLP